MGLDTVELIIAFEDRFGVRIPNEDAAELYTPRRVTDYLMRTEVGMLMSSRQLIGCVKYPLAGMAVTPNLRRMLLHRFPFSVIPSADSVPYHDFQWQWSQYHRAVEADLIATKFRDWLLFTPQL